MIRGGVVLGILIILGSFTLVTLGSAAEAVGTTVPVQACSASSAATVKLAATSASV